MINNILLTGTEIIPNSRLSFGWTTFLALDNNSRTSPKIRTEIMVNWNIPVTGLV
jgi:hypothetical protein